MSILLSIWLLIRALFRNRAELPVENLALRQQLAILKEKTKRPKLRPRDRVFWVWLSRFWANWRSALLVVQPDTVVRWHRQGFKLYWRWKSQTGKVGRPKIELEIRRLIRRMSRENPHWGVPRIQSELALLGHTVSEATVRKYRIRKRNPPSQTWRSFRSYFVYYHESRTHLSLNRNSPMERQVESPHRGRVVAILQVGGLHHRYCRAA